MNLPHSYFWHLAKSPVMIYKGRLYQLKPNNKAVIDSDRNFVEIHNQMYEFSESETIERLEELYKADFLKEIDAIKTDILNNELKDSIKDNVKLKLDGMENTKKEINKNQALLLILDKIIPEIEGKNPLQDVEGYSKDLVIEEDSKVKNLLGESEKIQLDKRLKQFDIKSILLSESLGTISNKKDKSLLGSYIFHNFNVIILPSNKFYVFSSKNGSGKVNIDGTTFNLKKYKEYNSLNMIERLYSDIFYHTLKCVAFDEYGSRIGELEEIRKQEVLLNNITEREEFKGKNGGFYRHSSGKFVFYLNFPQFINKFPSGDYYHFPSGQIAIGANYDTTKKDFIVLKDSISILSRYWHPFVKPFTDRADESHFCTGVYSISQKGKGYEKIPQVLVELRTLLMSGYNAYHRQSENIYHHNSRTMQKITPQQAGRKKHLITNENIVVEDTIKSKYDQWK